MLVLTVGGGEFFDEEKQQFVQSKGTTIELEHSLVSISKWEAKWKKPFLSREPKTIEETLDYIRFMTKTQHVDPKLYNSLTNEQITEVNRYIDDPMTATTISKVEGKGNSNRIITSEEIYYYMTAYQIPFECQRWHFNRLMMLIRICDEKNKPKKNMPRGDLGRRTRSLNASRRSRYHSRG